MGPASAVEMDDWDLEFRVNTRGVMVGALEAFRLMNQEGGTIVNIASNAGKVGFPAMAGYNASKAAVINLTRTLAAEWADKRINVNAVCPGSVATPMLEKVADFLAARSGEPASAHFSRMVPRQLGRHIAPVEVGRVVAFLLSNEAEIIRGQAINVDGGETPY